ncbi:MAG: sugar lactone lactonase YvrE [Verrucomicrobiales bacterium]|jgi:sugar lactone lactonase YvrE
MEPIDDKRAILGEGPIWHNGQLIWVDIEGRRIHLGDQVIQLRERVGCAWPCAGNTRLLCGLESGFSFLDPESGKLEAIANPEPEFANNRFNDGKCDPLGRFWAGTMDMLEKQPSGSLYRLDPDGKVTRSFQGVTVSNGLAWDPDGSTFYYIDSPTREVAAFDYDAGSGAISRRRVAIAIPEGEGFPDGMTIDREGKLWIALWGGWGVVRYDPKSGERLRKIELPVERVTSCTFGGADLDQLYITTASIGLDLEGSEAQPFAGGVFQCDPGVTGLAAVPFSYCGARV